MRQSLAIAEAEQASSEAQRREIELRIARSEIKAPRAGLISRRNAKQGAIAAMAAPEPLFRIIADAAEDLEAEVPEADIPRLAKGCQTALLSAVARPNKGRHLHARSPIANLAVAGHRPDGG